MKSEKTAMKAATQTDHLCTLSTTTRLWMTRCERRTWLTRGTCPVRNSHGNVRSRATSNAEEGGSLNDKSEHANRLHHRRRRRHVLRQLHARQHPGGRPGPPRPRRPAGADLHANPHRRGRRQPAAHLLRRHQRLSAAEARPVPPHAVVLRSAARRPGCCAGCRASPSRPRPRTWPT